MAFLISPWVAGGPGSTPAKRGWNRALPALSRSGRRWLCALALLLASTLSGQTPNIEYRIKAAYIFNFAKFVSWPSNVFAEPTSPIVIGILGKDPFGGEIDQTIAGKAIERRPLEIRRLSETDAPLGCHILFIAASERRRFPQVLESLGKMPILTVGEMEDFTEIGGMIQFVQHENNIRFEINLKAVERAGLKMSSKLLQVATVRGQPAK